MRAGSAAATEGAQASLDLLNALSNCRNSLFRIHIFREAHPTSALGMTGMAGAPSHAQSQRMLMHVTAAALVHACMWRRSCGSKWHRGHSLWHRMARRRAARHPIPSHYKNQRCEQHGGVSVSTKSSRACNAHMQQWSLSYAHGTAAHSLYYRCPNTSQLRGWDKTPTQGVRIRALESSTRAKHARMGWNGMVASKLRHSLNGSSGAPTHGTAARRMLY